MNKIRPQIQPVDTLKNEETQFHLIKDFNLASVQVKNNLNNHAKYNQVVEIKDILQCKICLQTSLDSNETFIQPCLCTGSLMYVHQHCFQQWMKRLIIQKNNRQAQKILSEGLQCQLCKMKYSVNINYQKVCISWKKLKEKVKLNKLQFILLTSLTIISIILLSITAAIMPTDVFDISMEGNTSNTKNTQGPLKEEWQKVVLIVSVFVLTVIIILSGVVLIKEFCFSYNMEFRYKSKKLKTMKIILQQ